MSSTLTAAGTVRTMPQRGRNYARRYWAFALPAAAIVLAVIIFPWVFTVFISLHSWDPSGGISWVRFSNYFAMFSDARFGWAVLRTLYFSALTVAAPLILGIAAAVCFHRRFAFRGIARTIFVLPMMATPVAIALVWSMMFHPQLGVLNYLLTSVGLPPSTWTYSPNTVIPTLAMVETWQWTPLVMLIVLGGLASLPTDPYEAAVLDGASAWQSFRHITLPLVWPFIVVAAVIRTIDALKAFDVIYVITLGGPGTASETINIFLYQTAFAYYHLGYAGAVTLVFFVLIVGISLVLLGVRQRAKWQ